MIKIIIKLIRSIAKNCVAKITKGGGVAVPVGGKIFSEVLPYLEVSQGNSDEVEVKEEVDTPDLIGKNLKEAKELLKESGLEMQVQNETEDLDYENTMVKDQTPKAEIKINKKIKYMLNINA